MILVVNNGSDTDVFNVTHIEDASRGTRSLAKVTFEGGEQDTIDLHKNKIAIFPNAA